MADLKPTLRVDVNKNPTKAGIKVQFVFPQTIEGDKKAEITQKLQAKLNQGLSQYNLTISQDTDTPYSNVIGFLIPVADIKLLIKNAITGGESSTSTEKSVAEIKRMKQLAGVIEEAVQLTAADMDVMEGEIENDQELNILYKKFKAIRDNFKLAAIKKGFDQTIDDFMSNVAGNDNWYK